MKNKLPDIHCNCTKCQKSCMNKPGWFLPWQVKDLLKHFGVKNIREMLGENQLAIDWWNGWCEDDILILAPNIKSNMNIQYPKSPSGKCVFFEHGKCTIYEIRPFECADGLCMDSEDKCQKRHEYIAKQWKKTKILEDFKDEIDCVELSIFDAMFEGII